MTDAEDGSQEVSGGAGLPSDAGSEVQPVAGVGSEAPPHRVAVLVCHGMGQQLPFQTLEGVARAIRDEEGRLHGQRPDMVPRLVRLVSELGDEPPRPMERIEITVKGAAEAAAASAPPREVHLYEAYWAPMTEGKVSSIDVMWFFAEAGFYGLLKSIPGNSARRRVFGQTIAFRAPLVTLLRLLAA